MVNSRAPPRCQLMNVFGAEIHASSSDETGFFGQRVKLAGKRPFVAAFVMS